MCQSRQVYDAFIFFNELDLLEIRLHELKDVVDKHVLVEGTKTFQGNEKPLYFEENRDRFAEFKDKIIHVVVDDHPNGIFESPWEVEFYTRNSIREGLTECNPEDSVIVSDVDEIPSAEKVAATLTTDAIHLFGVRYYIYFFNYEVENKDFRWVGPVMLRYKDITDPRADGILNNTRNRLPNTFIGYTPQNTRRNFPMSIESVFGIPHTVIGDLLSFYWSMTNMRRVKYIPDGGWHFTSLGGIDTVIKKVETYAHSDRNTEEIKDKDFLVDAITSGKDVFGRPREYEYVPLDNRFPKYLRNHQKEFESLVIPEDGISESFVCCTNSS